MGSDQNRYGTYKQGSVPRQKRTILLPGDLEDAGKWYRCWNCGMPCNIDREHLDQGEQGRGGSNPLCNLSLLLHMDGTDASTTFTDSSPYGVTVTTSGNAQIDTAYYKFSTGSGMLDGTGDYLSLPDSAGFDLSTGDWSIDFWVRGNWSGTGSEGIYFQRTDANNYFSITILKDTAGYGVVLSIYKDGAEVVSLSTGTPCISNTIWTHVEVSDQVATRRLYTTSLATTTTYHNYRIYVDGDLMASTQDTDGPANYTGSVYIGCTYVAGSATNYLTGWLDEFRVLKSAQHFDRSFDVPTAEYDESGYMTGYYSQNITSGCSCCGCTNYR